MFIKFLGCGHLEQFGTRDRTAHVRNMGGICYKCKKKQLTGSLITVHVRRRLFVTLETTVEKETTKHRLAKNELRPSRTRG